MKTGWFEMHAPDTWDSAWEILEHFGQAIQVSNQVEEQIQLTLEAVRDSLDADVVYYQPGVSTEAFACCGEVTLTSAWGRKFIQQFGLQEQLVHHFLDPGAKEMRPWPTSAVMVQVSQSRNSWVVALSFHPRRLFEQVDLKVLMLTRRILLNHRQQTQVYDKLRDSLFGLVRCLTAAIDAKNPLTWGHSERVARIAVHLGKKVSLGPARLHDLYFAGLLHDIGMIGIRDDIPQKPGPLSEAERAILQEHTLIGYHLVSTVKPLQHLWAGIRNHHERWDGKGYPDGLAGEQIPLQARIMALADAYEAMTSPRAYRPRLTPDQIETILLDGKGTQWDPEFTQLLLDSRAEIDLLFAQQTEQPHLDNMESVFLNISRNDVLLFN